jgi:hypothetical protein
MFSVTAIKYRDISVRPQPLPAKYFPLSTVLKSLPYSKLRGSQLDELRTLHVRWQLRQEPRLCLAKLLTA